MFQGRPLQEVAKAIIEQSHEDVSRTFTVPARSVSFETVDKECRVTFASAKGEQITGTMLPLAERQICAWAKIPADYFKRMREGHDPLLDTNVNYWLQDSTAKRMLRLFFLPSGEVVVRAWLGDRYRPIDHIDLLVQLQPRLLRDSVKIVASELTEERFYLKAIEPAVNGTITLMNGKTVTVCAGVSVRNSEVGAGRLIVEGMILQDNTTVMLTSASIRKNHSGRAISVGSDDEYDDAWEYFRDETRELEDRALWAKVGDTLDAALEESRFQAELARLQIKAETLVNVDEYQIAEIATKKFKLSEDEKRSVLGDLFRLGDRSLFSISTAVARAADSAANADRAYEIERAAAEVLEMTAAAFGDRGETRDAKAA
jgi:hypothetical protein